MADAQRAATLTAETARDNALSERDAFEARLTAMQQDGRRISDELAMKDEELKRVGGNRNELLPPAWDALNREAVAGECLELVQYKKELGCEAKTRAALKDWQDRFDECWISGSSRPVYLAGMFFGPDENAVALPARSGSVRFCDRRLLDTPGQAASK